MTVIILWLLSPFLDSFLWSCVHSISPRHMAPSQNRCPGRCPVRFPVLYPLHVRSTVRSVLSALCPVQILQSLSGSFSGPPLGPIRPGLFWVSRTLRAGSRAATFSSHRKFDFESCNSAIKLFIEKPFKIGIFWLIVGGTPRKHQICHSGIPLFLNPLIP